LVGQRADTQLFTLALGVAPILALAAAMGAAAVRATATPAAAIGEKRPRGHQAQAASEDQHSCRSAIIIVAVSHDLPPLLTSRPETVAGSVASPLVFGVAGDGFFEVLVLLAFGVAADAL